LPHGVGFGDEMGQKRATVFVCVLDGLLVTLRAQKVELYSAYVPQRPFHNSLSSSQTTPNGRSIVILRAIPV